MKFEELMENFQDAQIISCKPGLEIENVETDSRKIGEGCIFVALRGANQDGHEFVQQACCKGAAAVVVEDKKVIPECVNGVVVADTKSALAELSNRVYNKPSNKMDVVGITGTNGKTTTAYLIESIFEQANKQPGVIGTIDYHFADQSIPAKLTTPQAHDIAKLQSLMLEKGVKSCVMEVSSHALSLGRVDGVKFRAAVFTNLSQDHLDFHGTMEDYFLAKKRLFDGLRCDRRAIAVVNISDEWGKKLRQDIDGPLITYGFDERADVKPENIEVTTSGISFLAHTPAGDMEIFSPLCARVNIFNIMAAISCGLGLGVSKDRIIEGIAALKNIPGRMERVTVSNGADIVIDYAHTPDALERLLEGIKAMPYQRVITVFGCGGNRDCGKRSIMGEIAENFSDQVIVTNDNPRNEDPDKIIADIIQGRQLDEKFMVEKDRKKAIAKAIDIAGVEDVIVVAGKGHEKYQIIGERIIDFSDKQVCLDSLKAAGLS